MSKPSLWRAICLVCVLCMLAVIGWAADTFTTLVNFDYTDGRYPDGTLVQGLNGNFYGTTLQGGAPDGGTVFEITPAGKLTILYSFCSQMFCPDGLEPSGGVVLATNGKFYGTTEEGGTYNGGTVFEMGATGHLMTLYSFCSQPDCPDGDYPVGKLMQAINGNFYGTTEDGGANGGIGTVFEITPAGKLTTLHSFCSQPECADGRQPLAALVQAANGNFYGTTEYGGTPGGPCQNFSDIGCGTVFEITAGGKLTTLYSFCSQPDCADGEFPIAGLIRATNGNFYGTTQGGGIGEYGAGFGTVFEITPGGKLTTLYNFCSQPGCTDGSRPGDLLQAANRNFDGTTEEGGDTNACGESGCGSLFEITARGNLTTVYSFDTNDFGLTPPTLIQDTDGNFYGTTPQGGTSTVCSTGCGTVFRLALGLTPFVKTLPTSGRVGTIVTILGNNLAGTTSVTFNGTSATFKVVSSTEITAAVPSGATTGLVKVTTSSLILTSNVNFRVTFVWPH